MTDRYLVALDILATHGGTRTSAWLVAGELLESGTLEDAFAAVATLETANRLDAADRVSV